MFSHKMNKSKEIPNVNLGDSKLYVFNTVIDCIVRREEGCLMVSVYVS